MTYEEEYQMRQELYGPTHPLIRARCLELQKSWTDLEKEYRAGMLPREPRGWRWINGRGYCDEVEFGWTPPQYLAFMTVPGQSRSRRRKNVTVWKRV